MRWVNEGSLDRAVRVLAGLAALALGIWGRTPLGYTWDVIGLALLATGASGFCLVYRVMGTNTLGKGQLTNRTAH